MDARTTTDDGIGASEARFRDLADAMPQIVYVTDADGRITFINRQWLEYTGQASAQSADLAPLVHADDLGELRRHWQQASATAAPLEAKFRLRRASDGEYRWFLTRSVPVKDAEGRVIQWYGTSTDIHDQRQIEEELRTSELRSRRILESITDGFFTLDHEWRYDYVNPEAERILDRPAGALLGVELWQAYPGTIGSEFERAYRRVVAERISQSFLAYYPDHDAWYEVRAYPTQTGLAVYFRDVSEAKRAEELLRDNEERFRTLFSSMDEGFCVVDMIFDEAGKAVDYRIVEMNPAFERHTGLQGVIGRTVREFAPTLDEFWFATYGRVSTTGEPIRFVQKAEALDGRWFNVYAFRLGNPESRKVAILFNDITANKRAEQELVTRHQHARLLSDISARLVLRGEDGKRESADELLAAVFADVAHHLDANYYFNFALADEPETLRLVSSSGLDDAARTALKQIRFGEYLCGLVAQTRKPLVIEDLQHCPLQNVSAMCALGAGAYAGFPMLADGLLVGTISFASSSRLRFSPEELALVQVVVDLLAAATERDRLALSVREAEQQFRTLADNIPQLAWVADAGTDGQVHWFNKHWLDYTGTTLEQMQGSGWQTVHHPEHAERVIGKFSRHVKEGLDWEDTFPLRRHDGEFRWFLSRMKVIRDEAGTVVRIFGTNTDVTDQREMAERLQQQAADLAEADRRKDEFLAILAHELRNPLAPLRNGLQVLKLAKGNLEAAEQSVAMMERQLMQMVRLVDDLMEVSRISLGKIELHKERVDLATVVQQAVETSSPLIESSGHELIIRVPAQPVTVFGDLTRLAQVFANLLNNAAKFSERGSRITITLERHDQDATVSVADTGIGIPGHLLANVFDLFSQVDRSLEKTRGGLGIGLALAKGLVEMHGGSIVASSEGLGRGSVFAVRLPTLAAKPREVSSTSESREPRARPAQRILIVDDNLDSSSSLRILLELGGHEVITANDGADAVDAAESFRPQVILMDLGMPRLNGFDSCRRIREMAWGQAPVMIAVTGWGQESDKRRSAEAGFDHHLVKPVDFQALEKLLAAEGRPRNAS